MKILFQGDSITDAFRKPEEINPAFQLGNGYVFLIAARLGRDHPKRGWEFLNRGVSGDCVKRLEARWQDDAVALNPDVLSLLNGINDTIRKFSGKESECLSDEVFASTYRRLLSSLQEKNSQIHFVLMEPFLLEVGKVTGQWREHLAPRQRMVREIAGEFNAIFIPLQKLFDEAAEQRSPEFWLVDGIHATHAGFQLIADAWMSKAHPLFFDFQPKTKTFLNE
ncbi:MAG: SGNH/GDSL hydrolase family protein [Chthoniobacterales bacterium]